MKRQSVLNRQPERVLPNLERDSDREILEVHKDDLPEELRTRPATRELADQQLQQNLKREDQIREILDSGGR